MTHTLADDFLYFEWYQVGSVLYLSSNSAIIPKHCRFSAGSHVFSNSAYPFHLIKYSILPWKYFILCPIKKIKKMVNGKSLRSVNQSRKFKLHAWTVSTAGYTFPAFWTPAQGTPHHRLTQKQPRLYYITTWLTYYGLCIIPYES